MNTISITNYNIPSNILGSRHYEFTAANSLLIAYSQR